MTPLNFTIDSEIIKKFLSEKQKMKELCAVET